jgi:hypothetical protein
VAQELKAALSEFVRFAQTLRGDEKSEAQTFLDHFFRALGHKGVIEAGATFEFRVAKKPGSPQLELITGNGAPSRAKGGKKFADLLWPDRVLIEMKSRGENLEKHYDQTFDYWTHIVPKRPPFEITAARQWNLLTMRLNLIASIQNFQGMPMGKAIILVLTFQRKS